MHKKSLPILLATSLLVSACATTPPRHSDNICRVFDQYPDWYDYAHEAEQRWGTPAQILMAFIRRESGYQESVRPKRDWFLFIPLPRDSSAYGYAQAQDPIWEEYLKATGSLFKSRTDIEDALDFIGWYTNRIHTRLGISKWDPYHLYIAYHEGIGGYRRGQWKSKAGVIRAARQVDWLARQYGAQLKQCEARFQCRHWYQFWPFCSKSG
ncbi:MAG: hypothetical protein PVI56_11285 [Gammaproteobacteria bacterium]|jgi:hypothetical protein